VLIRTYGDGEAVANHLAVMEALANTGFANAPRLLGVAGEAAIEEAFDGVTALAVEVGEAALGGAVTALARLHSLALKEGLHWGQPPEALLPGIELPLHRLGFAAPEREAALSPLAALRRALAETPFGFVHAEAVAANVLFTAGRVLLVDFAAAGSGSQLADVAAFLLTAGAGPSLRQALAAAYARQRGLDVSETVELIDAAGLLWGLDYLLELPRRLIEAYGDEASVEAITTMASRIERGIRDPAGMHPAAVALRAALWQG
jgi:thiamine kinase-like enzyme